MGHETRFPLRARIVSAQRRLSHILDSFWRWLVSLFSKSAPSEEVSPQGKPNIELQRGPLVLATTFVKSHELLLKILALPLALLTIGGFYVSFAPKLTVGPSESISYFSPMGTRFNLSNEGSVPVYDVAVSCANLHIDGENLKVEGPWEFTNVPPEAKAPILSPGHKMSLPYPAAFGFTAINNFKGARLTFIVRYHPLLIPWRKQEIFPFHAIRTVDNKWIWESAPQ